MSALVYSWRLLQPSRATLGPSWACVERWGAEKARRPKSYKSVHKIHDVGLAGRARGGLLGRLGGLMSCLGGTLRVLGRSFGVSCFFACLDGLLRLRGCVLALPWPVRVASGERIGRVFKRGLKWWRGGGPRGVGNVYLWCQAFQCSLRTQQKGAKQTSRTMSVEGRNRRGTAP